MEGFFPDKLSMAGMFDPGIYNCASGDYHVPDELLHVDAPVPVGVRLRHQRVHRALVPLVVPVVLGVADPQFGQGQRSGAVGVLVEEPADVRRLGLGRQVARRRVAVAVPPHGVALPVVRPPVSDAAGGGGREARPVRHVGPRWRCGQFWGRMSVIYVYVGPGFGAQDRRIMGFAYVKPNSITFRESKLLLRLDWVRPNNIHLIDQIEIKHISCICHISGGFGAGE